MATIKKVRVEEGDLFGINWGNDTHKIGEIIGYFEGMADSLFLVEKIELMGAKYYFLSVIPIDTFLIIDDSVFSKIQFWLDHCIITSILIDNVDSHRF